MWKKRLSAILIFANAMLIYNFAFAAVSVETTLQDEGEPKMQFRLLNKSNSPIHFPRGLTPWSKTVWNGLVIIVVENGPGQKLIPKVNFLRNPAGTIEIGANQGIDGEILLPKMFPDIKQALAVGDVIVFWSYHPSTQAGVEIEPSGGYFLLKRRTL